MRCKWGTGQNAFMNSMLGYVFVAFLALAVLFIPREWSFTFGNGSDRGPPLRLLSRRELSLYDGEEGSQGLYLAILGQVFDVLKGHKHYGPGGAYHFMTGDGPLRLAGLLSEGLQKCLLIGRFYSETGGPMEALLQAEASLAEGRRIKTQSEAERLRFPACNSEWSAARGGRVWCSTKSGGVERGWTGVPRKLFSPGSSGVRCVCVEDLSAAEEDPNLQKYDGCPPHAESCSVEEF
ncbi:neuferricin isoform X2 [Anarrhichthys ocellatus]|uniref:neuferricin isoform X2 n=1 Tax=Anarrhichthys ocellatus TaxID=433405 RepID=UPI0012EDB98E|nr:neuferricin isoform X2 [Anarrhichthys ocellatus]